MAKKTRDWSRFFPSFRKELNSAQGMMGATVALATIGGSLVSGPFAPLVLALGGLAVGGSCSVSAYRAIPTLGTAPEEVNTVPISIEELAQIQPELRRLAIVGPEMVGKSTLLDRLRQKPPRDERTDELYAVVVGLPVAPTTYAAILDGSGGQIHQQLRAAGLADVIAVVLDHSKTESRSEWDEDRIKTHEEFVKQLRFFLSRQPEGRQYNPKKHIHFILNKIDAWGDSEVAEQLRSWFNELILPWENSGIASRVTKGWHSNQDPDAIAVFAEKATESLRQ
jgi:hypothetical protein